MHDLPLCSVLFWVRTPIASQISSADTISNQLTILNYIYIILATNTRITLPKRYPKRDFGLSTESRFSEHRHVIPALTTDRWYAIRFVHERAWTVGSETHIRFRAFTVSIYNNYTRLKLLLWYPHQSHPIPIQKIGSSLRVSATFFPNTHSQTHTYTPTTITTGPTPTHYCQPSSKRELLYYHPFARPLWPGMCILVLVLVLYSIVVEKWSQSRSHKSSHRSVHDSPLLNTDTQPTHNTVVHTSNLPSLCSAGWPGSQNLIHFAISFTFSFHSSLHLVVCFRSSNTFAHSIVFTIAVTTTITQTNQIHFQLKPP